MTTGTLVREEYICIDCKAGVRLDAMSYRALLRFFPGALCYTCITKRNRADTLHRLSQSRRHGRRVRDSQKARVYAWERARFNVEYGELLPLAQCRTIIDKHLRRYRIDPALVKLKPGGWGQYRALAWRDCISLPVNMRCRWVVLHELAHTITSRLGPFAAAAHGAEFMRVYLDLIHADLGLPLRPLRASLTEARIKVAEAADVPQPKRILKKAVKSVDTSTHH